MFGGVGEKRYFCSVILKTYTYLCSECTSYNLFLPAFSEMRNTKGGHIDRLLSVYKPPYLFATFSIGLATRA